MLFHVTCTDKPNHMPVRMANRPAHLEYVGGFPNVKVAGPLLSDDGQALLGSVLILDFPDRAACEAFLANDPYAKAGLFESVVVRAWKQVIGKPVGE